MQQETQHQNEFYVRTRSGGTELSVGLKTAPGLSELEKEIIDLTLEHASKVTQMWLANMLIAIRQGDVEREARRLTVVTEEEQMHHLDMVEWHLGRQA